MTIFAGIEPKSGAQARHRVAILAFDGVVLGDLAIPLEIFGRVRDTKGQPCYEVRVCGVDREVKSKHLNLLVPWRLSSVARADTVIVPGMADLQQAIPHTILRVLRVAAERGARIASICTGAFLLARAGLLDGLRATTHWRAAGELARRCPRTQVDANVLYVDNGQVLTSAGAAAGMDLCLHIVRRDHGGSVAVRVARETVMPLERFGGQAQFIEYESPEADASIGPLLVWMEHNLKKNLSLCSIARQARMSTRTLCRRFNERVGQSPAQWLVKARVRRAQYLLETSLLPVERIAAEAGFRSASVLREHFANAVGISPSAYRRSFGGSE